MQEVLSVEDLSFSFSEKKLFEHANFKLYQGEILGLEGKNGMGKSTLIDLIMGVRPCEHGLIRVLGESPGEDKRSYLQETLLVSQSYEVPEHLSIAELFEFYRLCYGRIDKEKLQMLVDLFKLKINDKMRMQSEGYKKRAQLVASLAVSPQLLVIDEITALIDAEGRESLFVLLSKLSREEGLSVLLASNITEDFEKHRIERLVINDFQLKRAA